MKRAPSFCLKRATVTSFLLMMMVTLSNAQQSPQFTQFMFNNLVINPAYAGAEEAPSITLLSRNQWTGVEKAPSTQSFSAHTLVKRKKLGLGLTVIRDQIGVHKNLNVMTNYAYHLKVGRQSFLSMGLQLGVTNLNSNYASLAGTSNDPKLTSINETMFGFGAGIYFRSSRFHLGISAPQLMSKTIHLNDTVSIDIRRINLLGYSRYRITLTDRWEMEPGVLVKYFPELPLSFDVYWSLIYRRALTVGAAYRKNESVDLILKFQLTTQLQLGYAYDYPISYAAKLSSASHEFMINYVFRNVKKHVASPR